MVTSDNAPAEISIPFIVSSVTVEITPVAETVNASEVPEVSVPETSKFPVMSVLSFKERFESESEIVPKSEISRQNCIVRQSYGICSCIYDNISGGRSSNR